MTLLAVAHKQTKAPWYVVLLSLVLVSALPGCLVHNEASGKSSGLERIRKYIASGWDSLTRSMSECESVSDSKLPSVSVLYLPAGIPTPPAIEQLQRECHLGVERLPRIHGPGEAATRQIQPHGLLYLEHPYVVPGGRFNEMYGWDSYFILRGLLRDGKVELALGMVENFFFEIEHYGMILNANRTYYLSRSQPPFLSSMIMAVYDTQKAAGRANNTWLAKAYEYARRDYAMWTREPHLAGTIGLSRYYDSGEGPSPESLQDESGFHRQVASYFLLHPAESARYLVETSNAFTGLPGYTVEVCDQARIMARHACATKSMVSLNPEYYKGDRSMRESGFDISFRFGSYSAATHHFAPVCLNSLLYKTEKDLEFMSQALGKVAEAKRWHGLAEKRATTMRKFFWNGTRGLFFDHNLENGKQSDYVYATTYYPLWSGWATPEEARIVAKNLSILEQPGGIAMSTRETGVQWDFPYGWAPLQLIVVEGLRNYGFQDDANRISYKFLSTVLENFQRDGTIREKYNVAIRSSEAKVTAGYQQNVIGFGWTNGVFVELLHWLPQEQIAKLDNEHVK